MLIHIHIPKNAGSTLNTILKRNFGERYTDFYTDRRGQFFSDPEFVELKERLDRDVETIHNFNSLEALLKIENIAYNGYLKFKHSTKKALNRIQSSKII